MLLAMPLAGEMGSIDHELMRIVPWLYAFPPAPLRWFLLILTASIISWAGRGIYISAIVALRHRTTNMNTLVSLGTSVAFVYSAYATINPAPGREVYFDAVLLILGFLLLERALKAGPNAARSPRSIRYPVCAPSPRAVFGTRSRPPSRLPRLRSATASWSCLENDTRSTP